jgi:hypothetical protein
LDEPFAEQIAPKNPVPEGRRRQAQADAFHQLRWAHPHVSAKSEGRWRFLRLKRGEKILNDGRDNRAHSQ